MTPVGAAMRGQEFYYAQFYLGQFRFERSFSKHLVCRRGLDGIGVGGEFDLDLGWELHQAQIAGIALSTTSVAVVYAVMVEGGFSDTAMGKMILAACFITDFGTVLALGGLFANYNLWLLGFVVTMCVVLWFMPRWTKSIITRLGATRVSEPEVKFIFFVLFFLGGLATTAKSEAVLPAYLIGLVVAGVFLRDKTLVHRMRTIA